MPVISISGTLSVVGEQFNLKDGFLFWGETLRLFSAAASRIPLLKRTGDGLERDRRAAMKKKANSRKKKRKKE